MSSTTTRVSLYKPAGGENVNVTTDIDNNMDKIDTNINFRVAASASARNAISPFWAGLNVRQTDDGTCWVSNGSAPISASWDQLLTSGTYAGAINGSAAATGTMVFNLRVGAEANNRFQVRGDGQVFWGAGGGTAVDTNLYRSAANTLKTDDNFVVAGTATVTGDLSTAGNLVLTQGGTAEIQSIPSTSVTVSNNAAEALIVTFTIPANDAIAGAVYKITAWGTVSTTTGTNNLNLRARLGGLAGTQLGNTGDMVNAASQSIKLWKAECYIVCLTTGASATWFSNLHVLNGGTVAGSNPTITPGSYIDGGVITKDSTVANDFVLTVDWTAASASNSWVCRGFSAQRTA